MQRRHNCVSVLGILAILATLLALQHHPGDLPVGTANCASAPSTPRASFECARDTALQQSHSDGFDGASVCAHVASRSLAAYAVQQANELGFVCEPLYGSLFRRPPPSLS